METRTGGCHCKKVRYEADVDLSKPVLECNCSHCQIKGLLLSFVPRSDVRMLSGENNLQEYRFNTERIAHMSCKNCSVEVFGRAEKDGVPMCGLNVRTIDDIDLKPLKRMPFDGRSI